MVLSLTQKDIYRETLANLVAKQNDDASIVSAEKELFPQRRSWKLYRLLSLRECFTAIGLQLNTLLPT